MAVAARIAICARRIGYPDMESVVMRVMATRSAGDSRCDRRRLMRYATQAALALALIDPETARTVLEQIEARSGLDPTKVWDAREPWLIAWALVDLKQGRGTLRGRADRARRSERRSTSGTPASSRWSSSWSTPPDRRGNALGKHSYGGFWWPAYLP